MSLAAALLALAVSGQSPSPKPFQPPDDRFKLDLLVVVAHPDDESVFFDLLARMVVDGQRRVGVVFTTEGGSGSNVAGRERARALGAVRTIEARRALASFGIHDVWFLSNPDIPSQHVLMSLGAWNQGGTVADVVRLVRLTRPEVMLTWLPAVVAGENHGDHQAAGVVGTEAFDLAGDPTAFPAQLAAPLHRYEGQLDNLRPWQPKRLYYGTDAVHVGFLAGKGPRYRTEERSPSQKIPYFQVSAKEYRFHESQGGKEAVAELTGHPDTVPEDWRFEDTGNADLYLALAKAAVKTEREGDLFAGLPPGSVPFLAHRGFQAQPAPPLALGGSWGFYRDFWPAHDLEPLAPVLEPEYGPSAGAPFHLPLLLSNGGASAQEVTVSATLPEGWTEKSGSGSYTLGPREQQTVMAVVNTPLVKKPEWREVRYEASAAGKVLGRVVVRVRVRPVPNPEGFDQ